MVMTNDEQVSGVVVRFADYKDYHRMLTLFTPKYGMISVLSPGSKRPKSPLRAGSEMFVFGNFTIKAKGERKTLSEVEIVDSFYDLRMDIEALACCYYMRDFCEYASKTEQDNPEMFTLFVRCLSLLSNDKTDTNLVRYAFEVNALKILGLNVILDKCIECGKEANKGFFNIEEGGVVCENCRNKHFSTVEVSKRAVNTLKLVSELSLDKLAVIKINEDLKKEMDDFWTDYIRWHLDKNFRSADFMDKSRDF